MSGRLKTIFLLITCLLILHAPMNCPAVDESREALSLDERIAALDEIIYALNMDFYSLTQDYNQLLTDTLPGHGLESHEKALERYRPEILLIDRNTETAISAAGPDAGAALVDLPIRFENIDGEEYAPYVMDYASLSLNSLIIANNESPFLFAWFLEVSFQLMRDESYLVFQMAMEEFNELAPDMEAAVDKNADAEMALKLVMYAYDLRQNTKVVDYHKKYGELIDAIGDITTLQSVYMVYVHAYSVMGDLETAGELLVRLDEIVEQSVARMATENSYERVLYDKSTISDFSIDMLEGNLEMPSTGSGGGAMKAAKIVFPEYTIKIANISQVQFDTLYWELRSIRGISYVGDQSYSENTGTVVVGASMDNAKDLAKVVGAYQFADFVVRVEEISGDVISFTALGKPTGKFNVMLPVFEYITPPDEEINYETFRKLVSRAKRLSGKEVDPFRNMVLMNMEVFSNRMLGVAVPAGGDTIPAEVTAQFPLLASFYYGQRGLAFSDSGMYTRAAESAGAAFNLLVKTPGAIEKSNLLSRRTFENVIAAEVAAGLVDEVEKKLDMLDFLIENTNDDIERVNLKITYANYHYLREEYDRALEMFEDAGKLLDKYGMVDDIRALIEIGAGNCAIMQLDHERAKTAYEKAVELAGESDAALLQARSLGHLARVQLYLGAYEASENSAARALELADAFADSDLKWQALYTKGRALEGVGRQDDALADYMAALEVIEVTGYSGEEDAKQLSADARDVYKYAFALCSRTNRAEEALRIMELDNALSLREEFEKGKVKFSDEKKQEAVAEINEYQKDIKEIEQNIQKQSGAGATEADVEQLKENLRDRQRDYIKYVNGLERTNSEIASLYKIEPVELVRVREQLPEDLAVVYFLLAEDRLYTFFVRADSIGFKEQEVDSKTVANQIKILRLAYSAPGQAAIIGGLDPETFESIEEKGAREVEHFKKIATTLYDTLFKPIEADLEGITKIAIIPNGVFHFAPFQALMPDEQTFLIQRYSMFYLDTLSTFQKPAADSDVTQAPLYAFGNADDTLPSAEHEVETISGLFDKSSVFIGRKASEEKAKELSENGGIFHFATHGVLDYAGITKSYILLATEPGSGEDGKFTIEEVWGYWWGDSLLVVLSACNTALGDLAVRGKAVNPASAFLNAGAPSVMATLWSVDDDATSILMDNFYLGLDNSTKIEALRNAQLELLKDPRTAHPFYWAPFTIIGDWR